MSSTTTLTFEAPRVRGRRAEFSFRATPESAAYRATRFHLEFPPALDLAAVPERLWWLVLLLCTQPQWPILAPCRVELPVAIAPEEIEFWLRLGDAARSTLYAHRGEPAPPRQIEMVAAGPPLAAPRPLASGDRCALAYSSGKDSLLHAGLLREMTDRPILVTTTSPLRELDDQRNARRRALLDAMARRGDFEFYEVTSDIRSSWENGYTARAGHPVVAFSELSDTFVYLSSLLVVAWLRGATHLFLASEAEVQESIERDGRVVQHSHFMYSAATQRALATLLRPLGMSFGSLTWGLPSALVMRLLWRRYADLAGLQFSCWKVDATEPTCSRCTQCLRIAFQILEAGGDPARAGFDLARLVGAFPEWRRKEPAADALPRVWSGYNASRAAARSIAHASPRLLVRRLLAPRGLPRRPAVKDRLIALGRALRLKWRTRAARRFAPPRARPGFLALADPLLCERLRRIVRSYCDLAPEEDHAPLLERSTSLTAWISAPLDARSARPARSDAA